jgi:hypothetical protein
MERTLLNYLPEWAFLCIFMIFVSAVVVLFTVTVRRYCASIINKQHDVFLYTIIGIISTYYAFLMGFTIIVLWQAYSHAILVSANEASHLALILEDSAALSQAFQNQITDAVGKYIKLVITEEWEAMRWGDVSAAAGQALNHLFQVMQSYAPQGDVENVFYREMIGNVNAALDARNQRINAVETVLPDPLRVVMILGAIITPCFLAIVEIKHRSVHLYTLVIISSILGFLLGFAFTVDYPFSGLISVSSDLYTQGPLARFK